MNLQVEEDPLVAPPTARSVRFFFRAQAIHLLFLVAMVPAAAALSSTVGPSTMVAPSSAGTLPSTGTMADAAGPSGTWLSLTAIQWFWISIGLAVMHQVYVWISWRLQLGWQVFSRSFGSRDFSIYCAIFFPLLIVRPLSIFAVGWADRGSLALPDWLATFCGGLLLVPAIATGYSVAAFFGMDRAAGGDHFRRRYLTMPFVRRGAFRWTSNAMYTLGFFGLWAIALLLHSQLALVAAIFQHGYIWAHYLSTEQPDIELLYGFGSNTRTWT
jgi:hypothetical protein